MKIRVSSFLAAFACAAMLLATAAEAATITLMDRTTNDGSFEAGDAGGDNAPTSTWSIAGTGGSGPFSSLNRNLSPDGSGPVHGNFTYVANKNTEFVLTSNSIAFDGANTTGFNLTGFYGARETLDTDFSVELVFDAGPNLVLVSDQLFADPAEDTWNAMASGFVAYSGSATSLQVQLTGSVFGATGNDQVYFDDLTLTSTVVPEPSTFALTSLAFAASMVLVRKRS